MTRYLIAVLCFGLAVARPEPPSQSYGPPGRQQGGIPVAAPASLPAQTYILQPIDAPPSGGGYSGQSQSSGGYSAPAQPSSSYGAPAQQQYSAPAPVQPSSSYGAPAQQQYSAPAPAQPSSSYGAPAQQQYSAPAPPSSNYGAPAQSSGGFQPQLSGGYSAPSSSYSRPSNGGGGSYHGGQGGGNFGSGSAPAQAIVQKHIYVHVPPPEPEEQFNSGGPGGAPVARKNYKIIFIKAPSYGGGSAFNSPALQAQSEEKTIVYVLVKKPEDQSQFDSQSLGGGSAPSKPEVYFIKYKATSGPAQGGPSGGFQGDIRGSGGGHAISAVPAPNLGGGELIGKVISGGDALGAGAGDQGPY